MQDHNQVFTIGDQFYLHDKPFKIISGAIHYFRVVPEYWQDRLEKLKALGCNTVETYVPWNMHEPREGEYHFAGMYDIRTFIQTAAKLGLYVILRRPVHLRRMGIWRTAVLAAAGRGHEAALQLPALSG